MRYALLATLAAAGTITASAASAMPLSNLGAAAQSNDAIQEVRLVCDRWGRCWRTAPRYNYGYYGPRAYYGPSYGYYGRPYRYYGGPGVGFSFRF